MAGRLHNIARPVSLNYSAAESARFAFLLDRPRLHLWPPCRRSGQRRQGYWDHSQGTGRHLGTHVCEKCERDRQTRPGELKHGFSDGEARTTVGVQPLFHDSMPTCETWDHLAS